MDPDFGSKRSNNHDETDPLNVCGLFADPYGFAHGVDDAASRDYDATQTYDATKERAFNRQRGIVANH